MSFVSLKTAILNKLNTLKGLGQPLNYVYDEHRTDFEGFPAATFEPSDLESDFETVTDNLRHYIFRIVIWQEAEKVGLGQSIDILADAVDKVIDAFDQDYTLGGACDVVKAVPVEWGVVPAGNGIVRYAEIKLECIKSTSIT